MDGKDGACPGALRARHGGRDALAVRRIGLLMLLLVLGFGAHAHGQLIGACCTPDGGCSVLSEDDCNLALGIFQGPGSDCSTQCGACCTTDGVTCLDVIEEFCTPGVGVTFSPGQRCADVTCPVACCLPEGGCVYELPNVCSSFGGDPRPGAACPTLPCFTGACCLENLCMDTTAIGCDFFSGVFYGEGTGCLNIECPEGCCFPDGSCRDLTMTECAAVGGVTQGTACDTAACDQPVACCLPAECQELSPSTCTAMGGLPLLGDFACSAGDCDAVAACCFADGTCQDITASACGVAGGRSFTAGQDFAVVFCPVFGACCIRDLTDGGPSRPFVCEQRTEADCQAEGETFQGEGIDCDGIDCTQRGGCCLEPVCEEVVFDVCQILGGTFYFEGCEEVDCMGGACCIADSCSFSPEADCLAQGGLFFGGGTECLGILCDDPTGACCSREGTCALSTALACAATNGTYAGDGTDCMTDPCPTGRGACCLPDDGPGGSSSPFICEGELTELECTGFGGLFRGVDSTCFDDPCPLFAVGACCLREGACIEAFFTTCDSLRGIFQGDGSACDDVSCDVFGGCCLNDLSCVDVTEALCADAGGTFLGAGSGCDDGVCDLTGPCCLPDGNCSDDQTALTCSEAGGTFGPVGETCGEISCPVLCCLADGTCATLLPPDCAEAGGLGGSAGDSCATTECPALGACCFFNGSSIGDCELLEPDACLGAGGLYQGTGSSCLFVICDADRLFACCVAGECVPDLVPEACLAAGGMLAGQCDVAECTEGACCLADEGCEVLPESACATAGGSYYGDGSICAPATCLGDVGACCLQLELCVITGEVACSLAGGDFVGAGSECTAFQCPDTLGACCLPGGSTPICELRSRPTCEGAGGAYLGDGTTRNLPCFLLEGACCLPDGGCIDDDEIAGCLSMDGTFLEGRACDEVDCPGRSACCLMDDCAEADLDLCLAAGGLAYPAGTGCADDGNLVECPAGACCLDDGSCILATDSACASQGGFFQTDGVGCDVLECTDRSGSCCLGADECRDDLQAETCAVLGGVFDSVGCEPGACELGACCIEGFCERRTFEECDASGGTFFGFGSRCRPAQCAGPIGACCTDRDICLVTSEASCLVGGGAFLGADTVCDDLPCPIGIGSCCLLGPTDGGVAVCIDESSEVACLSDGGFYRGDDTNCSDGVCAGTGACCNFDGTCTDDIALEPCVMLNGLFQGPGSDCATITCAGRGACCLPAPLNGTDGMTLGGPGDGEDRDCTIVAEAICIVAGGIYDADGTFCDGDTCRTDVACCMDDGSCQDVTTSQCATLGGSARGEGTTCESDCPTGACCMDDGGCVEISGPECTVLAGEFQDVDSSCATDCPDGACCLGAACSDIPGPACIAADGLFLGLGTQCGKEPCVQSERATATQKGSLLALAAVELRWGGIGPGGAGALLQDTFISLTNDYPEDVRVQMYFINGDAPLAADPATGERAHPGWNWVDNAFTLTGDQPTYWSALTGLPAVGGVAPFTALDPGFPPGRPALDGTGERVLRGYVLVWAVNNAGEEIRWNHLSGVATVVNYAEGTAWESGSVNYRALGGAHGLGLGSPGVLMLDGIEYEQSFDQLLMNFQAVGAAAFSGPRQVISDTELILHPVSVDLRQEADGPVTTKASVNVWNMNEVKFSGSHRCVTCWDMTRLSMFGLPNHFGLQNLQTAHGKARIDGLGSQVCDVDVDPNDGACGAHPNDVCSNAAALQGLSVRQLAFDGGADHAAAGSNLIGMGFDPSAVIRYDLLAPPPESEIPGTPEEMLDWLERQFGVPR